MKTLLLLAALAGCNKPLGPFCRDNIHVVSESGKWSVEMSVQDAVLRRHEERFARTKITPNGEAWAGLLEQCAKADLDGVELNPEAGALHAWVESDKAKERYVAALCRAVDDDAWLERCLARIDRDQLDD